VEVVRQRRRVRAEELRHTRRLLDAPWLVTGGGRSPRSAAWAAGTRRLAPAWGPGAGCPPLGHVGGSGSRRRETPWTGLPSTAGSLARQAESPAWAAPGAMPSAAYRRRGP